MENARLKILNSLVIKALAGFIGTSLISINPCLAQSNITPDNSLGNEASQINENTSVKGVESTLIEGGAIRGTNLFHSFSEFNIDEGRGAYFLIPNNNIENVLTRVTGNNPSNILGILGTISDRNFSPSNANLFLINPSGIVFGENSSLDLNGSFVGTTANAVEFENFGLYSATNPQAPSQLLTVAPGAFLFSQINKTASIQNNSVADVRLNPSTLFTPKGLRVADGKSLLLLGGDVNINGGGLVALGGRVELGGYSDIGTVNLNQSGNNFSLSFDDAVERSDITLTNGAGVLVNAVGGGNIAVNARNLEITEQSQLVAGIAPGFDFPNIQAGNIYINVTENITLKNGSFIRNLIPPETNGQGGDINVNTNSLQLETGGQITTVTYGKGKGGNLTVNAREVQIIGRKDILIVSALAALAEEGSSGDAGNLTIKTDNLLIKDGATAFSGTFGRGNAGKLTVDAEYVKITGETKDGFLPSSIAASALLNSSGNAGEINIKTNILLLEDGGQIHTFSERGNSGNLTIEAQDIQLIGESETTNHRSMLSAEARFDSKDDAGEINIKTNTLLVKDGAQMDVSSYSEGNVGKIIIEAQDIQIIGEGKRGLSAFYATVNDNSLGDGNGYLSIKTNSLLLKDGGQVNVNTWGEGNAGKLIVEAKDIQIIGTSIPFKSHDFKLSSGFFARTHATSTGDGGEIKVKTDSLLLKDAGMISTNTFAQGKGGNVFVDAKNIEIVGKSFDNDYSSGISGFAQSKESSGDGGDLTVRTDNLLIKDGGIIATQSEGTGKAGNININVKNNLNLDNGEILTQAQEAGGGNVNVTVGKNIFLRNNSNIKTTLSTTTGSGGNINLDANAIVALEDTDILAFAPEGTGGNVTFNTNVFLSNPLYRPTPQTVDTEALEALDGNNRVDINASGGVSAGTISGVLDANFLQDSLTELAENLIDSEALVASSCVVRSNQRNGSFFITGQAGLPQRPGDAISSQYSAVEVQSIKDDIETAKPISKWKIGDPIAEPSGIYRLANGNRVLSRKCGQ